jgi:hypothetical protein
MTTTVFADARRGSRVKPGMTTLLVIADSIRSQFPSYLVIADSIRNPLPTRTMDPGSSPG